MSETARAKVVDKTNHTVALEFLSGSHQNVLTHAPYKSDWYNKDTHNTLKSCSEGDEVEVEFRERPKGGSLQVMGVYGA